MKFAFFSYLNGDDFRSRCIADGPKSLRLVYNGIYSEQVRTYDLTQSPDDRNRFILETRVSEEADVRAFTTDLSPPDLFAPWRPVESRVTLGATDIQRLELALKSSGFFEKPTFLGDLSSTQFYWLVSGCINGVFYLRAFVWPEDAFIEANFPKLLLSWDFTGIPLNRPRVTSLFQTFGNTNRRDNNVLFTIRIRENRIN